MMNIAINIRNKDKKKFYLTPVIRPERSESATWCERSEQVQKGPVCSLELPPYSYCQILFWFLTFYPFVYSSGSNVKNNVR